MHLSRNLFYCSKLLTKWENELHHTFAAKITIKKISPSEAFRKVLKQILFRIQNYKKPLQDPSVLHYLACLLSARCSSTLLQLFEGSKICRINGITMKYYVYSVLMKIMQLRIVKDKGKMNGIISCRFKETLDDYSESNSIGFL